MSGPQLTPERRSRIEELFEAALDLAAEGRAEFLTEACAGDAELRAEVSALLEAHARPEGVLEADPRRLMSTDPVALAPGERVGHYEVVREIGRGGMAAVYLANDERHDRRLALKVLHPGLAALFGQERFKREIRFAARLHHPHILPLHDSGEAGGRLWYTMPYVDGESLRERLRREGRLEVAEAVRIACEVADALDYAHREGVIHRDVKPENLLLTRDGEVLVADFGIGRVYDASTPDTTLTHTGMLIGTPAYMSPEQALGARGLDGRTDVYSLGCVLYEMLAGQPPYVAPTPQGAIAGHIGEPVPSVRRHRPEVPPALESALRRALAKRPEERFETARRFGDALPAGAARAARPAHVAALALLVAAAMGTVYLLPRGRAESGVEAPAPGEMSLAVLPLTNLSGDREDEYFSSGMSGELTAALAGVPGLRVAARTSAFAMRGRRDLDARAMAERLNVGHLLEGSIRRVGDSLRVSIALVDAASGFMLWTESYERAAGELFDLQDEIARKVTGSLQATLPPPAPVARPAVLRAHDDYLRGRHALAGSSEEDPRYAVERFRRAIAADTSYAPAWSGLAGAWTLLADDYLAPHESYPEARTAALHALRLDSTLAEAHAALGGVLLWFEWDFPAARVSLERAIALDPNAALAFYYYGHLLGALGQIDSALVLAERATVLDPLSGTMVENVAYLQEVRGHPDLAVGVCDPERFVGSARELVALCRARALLAAGQPAEALRLLDRHESARADLAERTRFGVYLALGRSAEAREVLGRLEDRAMTKYVKPEIIAQLHAALGDDDAAFHWLERAYQARAGGMVFLATSRWWDPIRGDPRFRELVRRVEKTIR
ncbi:MAG: protein kinase [Gemmatimonadales bacterium]|nr:protein kinase [Gemmatimonadales bacterium]